VYEVTTGVLPNIVSAGGSVRPYVHAKVVAADGRVASIGSANFDATASYWEREAVVIVEDEAFTAGLEAKSNVWWRAATASIRNRRAGKRKPRSARWCRALWPRSVFS